MSVAVESLTKRGLMSREDAAEDRRATTLALTPAGVKALAAVDREMLGYLDALLGRTPDRAGVLESLGQLGQALEEVAAERAARLNECRSPQRDQPSGRSPRRGRPSGRSPQRGRP